MLRSVKHPTVYCWIKPKNSNLRDWELYINFRKETRPSRTIRDVLLISYTPDTFYFKLSRNQHFARLTYRMRGCRWIFGRKSEVHFYKRVFWAWAEIPWKDFKWIRCLSQEHARIAFFNWPKTTRGRKIFQITETHYYSAKRAQN